MSAPPAPTILLSAGEPSGDLHGAALAVALRRRWPDVRLFGLGGARMAAQGVELLADPERLSVMGFAEVVRHLPFFASLLRRTVSEMGRRRADLVIPIDYPGFNLRLARRARAAGVPVLYYIAPQVWAWHRSRARQLAAVADRLAVVFPFEQRIFEEAGARVAFVGHPLLDRPACDVGRAALAAELGVDPERRILALFPGSRVQEVRRHLTLFTDAAERVRRRSPDVQPVIAASSDVPAAEYGPARYPLAYDPVALLTHAAAALVKSGTSTIEAALARTPMVIAYRTHPLTFWLARRLVEVDHIGMANLIAGHRLAPELIQDEATPAALAAALAPLLDLDSAERARMVEGLDRVRTALAAPPEPAGSGASGADRAVPRADTTPAHGAGASHDTGAVADRVAALAGELLERHA